MVEGSPGQLSPLSTMSNGPAPTIPSAPMSPRMFDFEYDQQSNFSPRSMASSTHNSYQREYIPSPSPSLQQRTQHSYGLLQESMNRAPQPMDRMRSPQPMDRVRSPQPMDRVRSPQPMDRVRSPQPMDRVRSPQPMDRVRSQQPMDHARSPQFVSKQQVPLLKQNSYGTYRAPDNALMNGSYNEKDSRLISAPTPDRRVYGYTEPETQQRTSFKDPGPTTAPYVQQKSSHVTESNPHSSRNGLARRYKEPIYPP